MRRRPRSLLPLTAAVIVLAAAVAQALPSTEPDDTGMVNGKVRALAQTGDRIWVGGTFTQMLDSRVRLVQTVNNLAVFNDDTGAPDTSVHIPSVTKATGTAVVYDMSVGPDGTLYIAGLFDAVDGLPRSNVAAINPSTGNVLPFAPNPSGGAARSVHAGTTAVYIGTKKLLSFQLNGAPTPGYSAPQATVDPTLRTHTIIGQFTDISQVGSTLVAACQCDSITDASGSRATKAAVKVDAVTGNVLSWSPDNLRPDGAAFGIRLIVHDSPSGLPTVYLAGGGSDFTGAYDLANGAERWKTDTSGSSQAVAWHQGQLVIGGHFEWIESPASATCGDNLTPDTRCYRAPRLVALNASDGKAVLDGNGAPWNPGICCLYNGVWALSTDGDGATLHLGGEFTKVGGTWQFDSATNVWSLVGAQNQKYYARLAGPPVADQTLTVSKAGTASGTVTSSPAGINCGSTCSATFTTGATVTLTAVPAAGASLTAWSGACTGTGTCQVTMDAAKSVTATFEPTLHQLTVTKTGAGTGTVTSSPAGISCGAACAASYLENTVVTLTATAPAGSIFTGWSGVCTGTSTCQVTMSAAKSVTATFEIAKRLTVTKGGAGTGTVTSSPAGIDCGPTCSTPFALGTVVNLTATADAGSVFTGWSGDCTGTGTCQVTMTMGRDVTATFAVAPTFHQLTVTKTGGGSGTVASSPAGIACGATCSTPYPAGTSVTLTATPDPNSTFTGWSGGCTGSGTCQVTMNAAKSVTATFAPILHQLTVTKVGAGFGTVSSTPAGIDCGLSCSAIFQQGTSVTLTATPDANSVFTGWSGDCTGTGTCEVTMSAVKSVTATFAPILHQLAVTKAGAGSGTVSSSPAGIDCGPTCSADYIAGTIVTLTATPGANSTFTGWSGGCTGSGTCQITMVAARNVTATFGLVPHLLTVTKAGTGSGTVTSTPAGIDCGPTCAAAFPHGMPVTLNPIAGPGSVFTGWSDDCTGTGTCEITMNAARRVNATFDSEAPCGNRIVFVSNRTGNTDVFTMNVNGTGATNLTQRSGTDNQPAWSPDCSKIAFSSARGGNTDIFTMNADGSGVQKLTTAAAADTEPTWSPDGLKIAFVSARMGNTEIFTMTASGGSQLNVSNNASTDTAPDWSPDGVKIAFTSARSGSKQIYKMNANGTNVVKLTTGLGACDAPAWSPDGANLAFTSKLSGTAQIYVMNAGGSGATRLTTNGAVDSHPSWSPTGAKIAFSSTQTGKGQIFTMNADGTAVANISANTSTETGPTWSN